MFERTAGIDFINSFSHSGKPVSDLSRIEALMSALGNPQDKLKFVHIAGTNGKGSMAEMFSGIFREKGLKTGLFTSPYILDYTDRIRIDGKNISRARLGDIAMTVKKAAMGTDFYNDYSQFEITTAIGFLYFLEEKCDIVVLETGLGGLLDCTNIVKTSVLTVIGSIAFDHTAILGNTLEAISTQKAGIIKSGVPCVLSAGNDMAAVRVVSEKAREKSAQLVIPDIRMMTLIKCDCFGSMFRFKGGTYTVSMGGAHQVLNALSVIMGARLLMDRLGLSQENIENGIASAMIAGRVQIISENPMIICDGAHNPDGTAALAGVLEHSDFPKVNAVIGMCRDKNICDAVLPLIKYVDCFYTVDGFNDRAEGKAELAEIIKQAGGNAKCADMSVTDTVKILSLENPNGLTLVCGSLYLASYYLDSMSNQ